MILCLKNLAVFTIWGVPGPKMLNSGGHRASILNFYSSQPRSSPLLLVMRDIRHKMIHRFRFRFSGSINEAAPNSTVNHSQFDKMIKIRLFVFCV